MKKKKQEKEIIKCETLEDAEKIVSDKRAAGINPRVISQTTFVINNQEKRFNILQISKIEKRNDHNQNNEFNLETTPKDSDKSLTFKLFRQGKTPVDVIIETNFTVDYVKKSHVEFLEFTNQELIPNNDINWLYKLASRYSKCDDTHQLGLILEESIEKALQYDELTFPCSLCGEDIKFSKNKIGWVREKLEGTWKHTECLRIYKEF